MQSKHIMHWKRNGDTIDEWVPYCDPWFVVVMKMCRVQGSMHKIEDE